jgi:deoxyadenosine/deoxycytidine kinase
MDVSKYRGKIIVIEGIIGAGKSELATAMYKYLKSHGIDCQKYPEYVNTKLLSQFINNQPKYAYTFQLFMLNKRIETYNLAKEFIKTGGCAILDRSLLGDSTFAYMQHRAGNISDEEWAIYNDIADVEARLELPHIVYLNVGIPVALSRIAKRNRDAESSYDYKYLHNLMECYQHNINTMKYDNIINIDWNADREVNEDAVTSVLTMIQV